MSKYIDAEKLKVLLSELKEEHKQHRGDFHEGVVFAVNEIVDDIEESINSLKQEQSEIDIEKIVEEYLLNNHEFLIEHDSKTVVQALARYFYDLGRNSRKEG